MVKGKELIHSQQFVFKCTVTTQTGRSTHTEGLTDSGATGNCASRGFAQQHRLQTFALRKALQLRLGDGGLAKQSITRGVMIPVQHGDHQSEELFYEVDMKGFDLIFGLPWLEDHNPHIDWRMRTMTFDNHNQLLYNINKEAKVRRSTRSLVIGKAKVISYEDLDTARAARAAKDKAAAEKGKGKRGRKRKVTAREA